MRKHTVTVRDTAGNVIASASVTVYIINTTTKATLYSDNGVTEITNPVTTNSKGQAGFYVADGVYDLYVSGTNLTAYTLEDVTIYEPVGVTASQTLTNKTLTSPIIIFSSVTKTSAYTPTAADFLIHCNAAGGAFTLTLPSAALHTGRIFVIGKSDSSAYAALVDGYSTETIDGVLSIYLYLQYDYIAIQSDGSNWKLLSKTWQEAIIHWSLDGALTAIQTGIVPAWIFTWLTGRIFGAYAYMKTAPSSNPSVYDINKNGTTIWSTQANRLSVATGAKAAVQSSFNTTALTQDDVLTVDYDSGDTWESNQLTILLNVRVQSRLLS